MQTGMHIFPQDGGLVKEREIPVENSKFSTFSTGFSTRVFHSPVQRGIYRIGSHNSVSTPFDQIPTFSPVVNFTTSGFLCKNSGLDRGWRERPRKKGKAGDSENNVRKCINFFEKGVDFILQRRYNVWLYGKPAKGGATHAQH